MRTTSQYTDLATSGSKAVRPQYAQRRLYVKGLPAGLTFSIVEIKPSIPNGSGWLSSFRNPDAGSITAGPYVGSWFASFLPVPSALTSKTLSLVPLGLSQLHQPPVRHLSIQAERVCRHHQVDRQQWLSRHRHRWESGHHLRHLWHRLRRRPVLLRGQHDGLISKGLQRPDFYNVTYYWPGSAPVNLSPAIPGSIIGQPDDVYSRISLQAWLSVDALDHAYWEVMHMGRLD